MVDNKKIKVIVIGGSAGSFPLITAILSSLPKNYRLPLLLSLHRLKNVRNGFVEALSVQSNIPVMEPLDKQKIISGKAYLAPANYHMNVEFGYTISLSTEEQVKFSRPSIDLTFDSASYVYRDKMIGIILSGANSDGANGIRLAHKRGSYTVVQDPSEAQVKTMPESALNITKIDEVLNINQIIELLVRLNQV